MIYILIVHPYSSYACLFTTVTDIWWMIDTILFNKWGRIKKVDENNLCVTHKQNQNINKEIGF